MSPAGYSGTPLPRKLGIKPGHRVALVEAPPGFERTLVPMPDAVDLRHDLRGRSPVDVILYFAPSVRALEGRFAALARRIETAGGLWIAWPKKSSDVATDLSDGEVRRIGLQGGLVDNKVCAVDETWSGLRFVRRVKDR